MPKITVAVPTCGDPRNLSDCLRSVLPQLTPEVELLVVDNSREGAARTIVSGLADGEIRYVHEPRSGVVFARNRAVQEARGEFLAFIDDDETADFGWIRALLQQAARPADASFGRVAPRILLSELEPSIGSLINQLHSRDLKLPSGADVSSRWSSLGTGNSMFKMASCFDAPDPFPVHLNSFGSEDTWLIKSLIERGLVLVWNPDALVYETVPEARADIDVLMARKYRNGQARVLMVSRERSVTGCMNVVLWMFIGMLQWLGHGGMAVLLKAVRLEFWIYHRAYSRGGLGKILWWRRGEKKLYSR